MIAAHPGQALVPSLVKDRLEGRLRPLALVGLVLFATLLLYVSAKVKVPFYPVPMTLQTLAVLLIGALYGARLGALTVLIYLGQGALGLPVFSGTPEQGLGLAYLAGPTGGFLLGMVPAAFLAGLACERLSNRPLLLVPAQILALAPVYLFGVLWLASFIGLEGAISLGLLIFLPGELLKVGLAGALVFLLYRHKHS